MTSLIDHTAADVDAAAQAAHAAFASLGCSDASTRASLLRALASTLEAQRDSLVRLADEETHLGSGRLNGELDRTTFQLRGFAARVEQGAAFAFTDDPAVAGPPPMGHPHLMRVRVPLGPVAVFSASNFPFAFSVLGGDTASALAAGCPVIVKVHSGHRALSHAVADLAQDVVRDQGLPEGVFGRVDGRGNDVGLALVKHPLIQAAAFTGSLRGGLALQQAARQRPQPIPFFGELGSVNPFVVLPAALAQGAELAEGLAASITMGCGQFCTSPGIIVVPKGPEGDAFIARLAAALESVRMHSMLTPQMREAFAIGTARWAAHPALQSLVDGAGPGDEPPRAFLAQVDACSFVAERTLHEEVFGPAALVVRVANTTESVQVLEAIGGSLTVTVLGAEQGPEHTSAVVRAAMRVAGRVLFKGFPTGVAVSAAQQHGGPFPASTQPATTSVGWAAMDRFLRPVALQEPPGWLLERKGQPC